MFVDESEYGEVIVTILGLRDEKQLSTFVSG